MKKRVIDENYKERLEKEDGVLVIDSEIYHQFIYGIKDKSAMIITRHNGSFAADKKE